MDRAAIQQLIQKASAHHHSGRLAEAERLYRVVLDADPNSAEALHHLGLIAHTVGRHDVAIDLLSRAVALDGASAEAWNDLGMALAAHGRTGEAAGSFRKAVTLKANFASGWNNLGSALNAGGRFQDAADCYRRALALAPNRPEIHLNLSRTLASLNQMEESEAACRQAIALRPDYVDAINTLGARLMDQSRSTAAMECFRNALTLQPDHVLASNNLANALKEQGRLDEAILWYRKALELYPGLPAAHSNLLLTMEYHPGYDSATLYREHLAWAARHAAPLEKRIRDHHNDPDPGRRLRVGYVSADWRRHSVASFMWPLLVEHDHQWFEIICYSDVRAADTMTEVLRKCADRWCDIAGWTDEQVAQRIVDDRVDLLVDLGGHTANNRLKLFARKPAPVQVSYLGDQSTTGLATIDYRLTDEHLDPPGLTEAYHTELLFRLPRTFACYRPEDRCPQVAPVPAMSRGWVTFGSFNKLEKISPQMLEFWGRIVATEPGWRLMIMAPGLEDAAIREYVRRVFTMQGGDARQLDLQASKPFMEYMAAHAQVDIVLDTFPFNGHTTTCHGLWMGVPIVTLAGDRYASRMGLSVLTNLRLKDLVATTPDQYVQLAVQLAQDGPRLAELRRGMRDRMRGSPLMDERAFAREVEVAYRWMWEQWCHQRKSAP